eukprot:scaffold32099_cov50-Attheya_sp.AAC.7
MVSTRRSTTTRKAPLPKEETKQTDDVEEEPATDMDVTEPQPPISEGDESPEEEPKASPKKKKKASKNSSKKAEAKTRNKGIGLNIPNGDEQEDSAPRANKKIVFSDDFEADDEGDNAIEEPSDDDDDDSDGEDGANDDAVEEVGTSDAKNQALNQLAMEREVAQEDKLRHRKKKRKAKELPIRDEKPQEQENDESDESDVDDIDEDFLAAVDSELATSRKEMKALKKQETLQKKFAGKHTTFVSDGNLGSKPIPAEHNIELVLLGSEDNGIHSGSSLGTKPSEAAKLFSRGRLEMDFGQENGKSKKEKERKGKHPSSTQDEGWTRSKKMKFIGHGTQMRHMKGRARGRAAVQFITKQKN